MSKGPRYAVFYVPEPSTALADFGRRWFGRDPETGEPYPRDCFGVPGALADALIETPSIYGLHATLVAPFYLNDATSADDVSERVGAFARACGPFALDDLSLARLGHFLALRPGDQSQVAQLARGLLFTLDNHRARPSDTEIRRRMANGLTANQRILLATYGYPYVMDEYRFHITLTGHVDDSSASQAKQALAKALGPTTRAPLAVRSICLLVQPAPNARFRVFSRWPLGSA